MTGSKHVDGQKANSSAPSGDRVEPAMIPEDGQPFPSPLIAFLASHGTLTWILLALAIVGILCVMIISPGCSEQTAQSASFDVNSGPLTVKDKGPIDREAVERLVSRKLGDTAAAGDPVLRSLELVPEAGGVFVSVELNRTESCHPGQLVGTAATLSQQVMSSLFRYPDVSRVRVSLYGTTKDLVDKDKLAASFTVDRERAKTIDWFQFTDANVEQLATEMWIEPGIYTNWKIFGSQAITDSGTRAAANANSGSTP